MFDFTGKFEFYQSENCDKFFAVTVPESKSIANTRAELQIKQHGKSDIFEMIHTLPNKTIHTVFKLGVPFLDEVPTGNVFKSVGTVEGNVLKIQQTFEGKDYGRRSMEFSKDELIVTILVPQLTDIQAKRIYHRID